MSASKIVFPNLRAEIGRCQLTIEQMAQGLGLNRNTLSRKLRGEAPITLDEAFAMSNLFFFGKSIEYLFGERD